MNAATQPINTRSAAYLSGWDHGFFGWSRLVEEADDTVFARNYSAGYAKGAAKATEPAIRRCG